MISCFISVFLKIISKSSKLKCLYFPLRNGIPYMKSDIKAEVVNGRPLIIEMYDMFDNGTAMAISYMGYKKVTQTTPWIDLNFV